MGVGPVPSPCPPPPRESLSLSSEEETRASLPASVQFLSFGAGRLVTVTGIPSSLVSSVPFWSRTWCPMQRFLQLPGAVVRPGGRGADGADQEAASPVLAPEGGPPPWYQALQPEELRWLQAPEEDTTPETSLEGPCLEPGQGHSQRQPLRYRGAPRDPHPDSQEGKEWEAATLSQDPFKSHLLSRRTGPAFRV